MKSPPPSAPASAPIGRHPSHALFTAIAAFGTLMVVAAMAAGLVFGSGGLAGSLWYTYAALGGSLILWGIYGRAVGAGVQLVNSSFNLIALGRFGDAERLLDQVEQQSRIAVVHKAARVQRAIIALRRGDVRAALGAVDTAVSSPLGFFARAQCRMQTVNAQAIRAFLRASTGDRDGAAGDIAAVRADPRAIPQSLARAALAEAVLLERSGDRAGLREHLLRERTLLLEGTDRRERSIVRAYQRMLAATATTPYRKPVPREAETPAGEEPTLSEWIEKVAPGAAAYVAGSAPATGGSNPIKPLAAPSESARKIVQQARAAAQKAVPKPRAGRFVVLTTLTMFGILIGIILVSTGESPVDPDVEATSTMIDSVFNHINLLSVLIMSLLALFVGMVVFNWREARKQSQRLITAAQSISKGRIEAAEAMLAELTASRLPMVAASAYLSLATTAERRADLAAALTYCDRGLGRLARYASRVTAADILLPELVAERAFLLTAMDRTGEAHAELASLGDAFPYLGRARFRVRLLELVRQGNLFEAAQFAMDSGGDLPLSPQDELLADAVRAAARPELTGSGELERIREEVRVPQVRRWMETVAPNVLVALEKTNAEIAVESDSEALAEEEAARALAAGKRRARHSSQD